MSRPIARVLLLLFICAAVGAQAQEPAVPAPAAAPALTIEDCIARAMQKNFSLKIQSFSTEIAHESFNVAHAGFDPTFTASAARGIAQPDNSTVFNVRSDSTATQLGVNQLLATGATVGLTSNLGRRAVSPALSLINPAYTSNVALNVSQPLLRGAGVAVNRAAIERSRIGVSIANLNYRAEVLQVVHDTEVAYNNLVFAREQLVVKQLSLTLAQRLLDENKTRKLTGVATDLDVLSADVGVANARNGIVTAEQAVQNSEDALAALIGNFDFDRPPGRVHLESPDEPVPSFNVSYKLARDHQPDFLAAQAVIKQYAIDAHTAKNSRLPSLSLGGALGYNGTANAYETSFNRLSAGRGYNWQLDLSLSVPWGLRADRARYRSAQAGLRQQEARLQQLDQNLVVQVRSAVRAVDTNRQSVAIYGKATELAAKQYELELARFKAGLATSREVLQTQDDLEAARVNELSAQVNYRNAIASLRQLESASLARYHITLPD